MKKTACLLVILFLALTAGAQKNCGAEALTFLQRYESTSVQKLSAATIDSAILNITILINNAETVLIKEQVARLYTVRAELETEKLAREQRELNSNMHSSSDLFDRIESDYNKACELSQECACEHLEDLHDFFLRYENEAKAKEVEERMKNLGISDELHTFLGLGVNYLAPKNILGIEMSILGTDPIRQKKTIDASTGKPYRPCGYQYPMSIGLLTIGYEASLGESMDPAKYNGVKLDPIWINYYVALRPTQFLFCNSAAGNSFVWRPEIGYSFASFSISYAYNLAFKRSFTYLPPHNFSIHIMIPSLHMEKD